jgi:hypothetical protein
MENKHPGTASPVGNFYEVQTGFICRKRREIVMMNQMQCCGTGTGTVGTVTF